MLSVVSSSHDSSTVLLTHTYLLHSVSPIIRVLHASIAVSPKPLHSVRMIMIAVDEPSMSYDIYHPIMFCGTVSLVPITARIRIAHKLLYQTR
ncbi:hypothetical protein GYMLUDRAFT_494871 [Collybiopsis luxurians FD-317 M1]|uniref:Uncharacterized protein n=1 Tax=Collybiopsis luxurians FD-317 M1 TaxID=944289 RepID=A0A0D0BX71_9AGAR|nr:hypothetical protein GYMLUDRAFT_494871 [Collybiopsis luxurians FD-317 M1]